MLTCVQIQFKGASREIGLLREIDLLSNMISNVTLKLEISYVKAY